MSKLTPKVKRIQLNKVCRSCLTERGHLREIFSTRIPMMMETCASVQVNINIKFVISYHPTELLVQVSENDELPTRICVSCFQQIARFYSFKKKIERSDRILRNYVKQLKLKAKPKEYSDILDIAVNDAEIEVASTCPSLEETISDEDSEDDIPLIERQNRHKEKLKRDRQLSKKCIDKTNESPNLTISKSDDANSLKCITEASVVENNKKCDDLRTAIFTDGPPPLVPLASTNSLRKTSVENIPVVVSERSLPENTPPLIPIKPLSTLKPEVIIDALGSVLESQSVLKFNCSMCSEEFSSVSALKEHKQTNCQLTDLQCNICKKEFKDRKRLIGHLKGHMVAKDYRCKMCGKCYPNPSTFRVHMRTHTGERPFSCQVCNKGFVRWAGVVNHMKTHSANKPHKCSTCGKGFKILSNLERHKVLHSGNLPFCCNYCGKTFSQSDNLQLHIRTYHTHERPYLCNECGKGFVSSTRLNRHMWVHTGFKPYTCKQCPKAYSNSNDLKNHERLHNTGGNKTEKPYACMTCEMRFIHPCRLAKHMKTHERPFACSECTKTFSTEGLLVKHVAGKHGPQFFDEIDLPVSVEEVFIQYQ